MGAITKIFKSKIHQFYDKKGGPILVLAVGCLFILEKKYALRKRKLPLLKRLQTNAVVAATAGVCMRMVLVPVVIKAAELGSKRRVGVLSKFQPEIPGVLRALLGFLILDYSSYRWHKLTHQNSVLWKFHQVHHADLDLDVSTALRFHAGEVLISVLYRGAWALFSGVTAKVALVYEIIFELATNFHHTNLKLPQSIDTVLSYFIVTPRMHGIHHSVIRDETDSNFSVVLTIWDKVHKTFRLDIPQNEINIGVPYVRIHKKAKELLIMPFKESPEWKFPNGEVPTRGK